jgi:hypothetical protein
MNDQKADIVNMPVLYSHEGVFIKTLAIKARNCAFNNHGTIQPAWYKNWNPSWYKLGDNDYEDMVKASKSLNIRKIIKSQNRKNGMAHRFTDLGLEVLSQLEDTKETQIM